MTSGNGSTGAPTSEAIVCACLGLGSWAEPSVLPPEETAQNTFPELVLSSSTSNLWSLTKWRVGLF
jgi:hypothetical protein